MVKSNSVNKHDYSSTPSVLNLCQEMTDLLLGSMGDSDDKEFVCSSRDQDLIPGSGRSPGEGNDNLFQYSCLESSMDRGAWWAIVHGVTKSETQLSDYTFTFFHVGFSSGSGVKNLPANAGVVSSVPGSGRSPGEGNGSSLQYSCLGHPMDRGAWQTIFHGVMKSGTRLSK